MIRERVGEKEWKKEVEKYHGAGMEGFEERR